MSKAIDELREHFNQRPVPNSKVIIEERNKVNAMIDAIESENVKLRELARDMWCNGMCECDESGACAECEYHFPDRMRELGVEI